MLVFCLIRYLQIADTAPLFSRFLGTSGQNIDDLSKYSEAEDKLEFLERTLRWRHLAPTAPNTLGKTFLCSCFILKLVQVFFLYAFITFTR